LIEWNISPEIFSIGPISVRWYGVLFALSFIAGFQIMHWIYKKENRPEADLNDLIWYMILGTVIGARLGHCLFYNPNYYLSHPFEILKVWQGGLASHGGAIGILIALFLYSKKKKDQPYLWVLDRMVIVAALGAFFIRMGNLFNSEIVGKPTDLPWSFLFVLDKEHSIEPRHPAQLYEALAYLISFFILLLYYKKKNKELKQGFIFGLFLVLIFGFRFIVEFLKETQSLFEKDMILNMGQLLSIPLILLGIFFIFRKPKKEIIIR
jgi:phosphatidylglycerol---prolipoprotein diacylglyceryl transferase